MQIRYRFSALWFGVCVMCGNLPAYATSPETEWVTLVETEDSLCLAHGGMLVTLQLAEAAQLEHENAVEVWIDRWFMQVQTADHTRHVLTAEDPSHELGCSHSIAGPQHWTLSTIKRLPAGSVTRRELP
jgi:hypothetical protein